MLDDLILLLVVGGVTWLPIVIILVKKMRNPDSELPVTFHAFWVCFSLGFAVTLIEFGWVTALISIISPLLPLAFSTYFAFKAGLYAAIVAAGSLFLVFIFLARRVHGMLRYLVSTGAIMVILTVPILVQSPFSDRNILASYEALNGDCLSRRSFWKSVINVGRYKVSHAVMFRGDEVFVWSYANQQFINVKEGRYLPGYVVPNGACNNQDL